MPRGAVEAAAEAARLGPSVLKAGAAAVEAAVPLAEAQQGASPKEEAVSLQNEAFWKFQFIINIVQFYNLIRHLEGLKIHLIGTDVVSVANFFFSLLHSS